MAGGVGGGAHLRPRALLLLLVSALLATAVTASAAADDSAGGWSRGAQHHARRLLLLGSTTGVTLPTFRPNPKLINGLIQAGFTRAQAAKALEAVGNEPCCERQMVWLFNNTRKTEKMAEPAERECHSFENTDFDGYAVTWGSANLQDSTEACCQSCKDYVPKPPSYYPCNIWVWCGKPGGCFAPAAGDFIHRQCWLKYQEHPENPQVNMKGAYSESYLQRHPTAPKLVDWTAGVVVGAGVEVTNGTWSSRSDW